MPFVSDIITDGQLTWADATVVGEKPVTVTIADGQTIDIDVPVVDAKEARAKANVTGVFVPFGATVTPKPTPKNEDQKSSTKEEPANPVKATGPTFRAVAIDRQTDKPVAGIRLWSLKRADIEGISNADGLITIDDMPAGEFRFEVSAVGEPSGSDVAGLYARWQSPDALDEHQRKDEFDGHGFQRNFDFLKFNVLGNTVPMKIFLERGVTISGHVIDPDGNPIAGATVAPAETGTNNSITGDTRYSVRSNQDGLFQIRLPASGKSKYNLVAHDGDYQEWRRWANGVGEVLRTKPGDELTNVELKLTRPCLVRGKVIDASGKPISNHDVRTQPADMLENRYYDPTTKTNERGEFTLRFVRPGKQFAQAEPFWLVEDNKPQPASQPFAASPDQPVEGIILSPNPVPKNRFGIPLFITDEQPASPQAANEQPANAQATNEHPATANQPAAPVEIPIIVAKHVMLHDGKIIQWEDIEKLIAALPNPKRAQPGFYFTNGALPQRQEEIRAKIKMWDLQKGHTISGHAWGSLLPRAGLRYDAIRTAADLVPNEAWRVNGTVETADGLPIDGAEVVLCPPVEASLPYKTLDIYLRNEHLRQPFNEIVTTSNAAGRFTVYPPPDTLY